MTRCCITGCNTTATHKREYTIEIHDIKTALRGEVCETHARQLDELFAKGVEYELERRKKK